MDGIKHTPGPWKKESHRNIVNLNSKTIVDIAVVLGGYESEEADANLRLMIAAPELYEIVDHIATAGSDVTPELMTAAEVVLAKIAGRHIKTCDDTKGNYDENPLLALYDEVIQQCMIREVIGRYIGLSQIGKTPIYKGICPFHQDHKPSMEVNTESQKFKCLSCGESGDVVDFLMKYKKTGEKNALFILATKAGIDVDEFLKDSK